MPEYFETALKTRYSQDSDTGRMFDLIRNSIIYDPGQVFASFLGTPSSKLKDNIMFGNSDWVSGIAANENVWQTALDDLWESVTSNN